MDLSAWVRKHSMILIVGVTSTAGLLYSCYTTNKRLATLISLCSFGSACLQKRYGSRHMLDTSKVVIVTGCDSGLGYSLALHCQYLGATVIASVLDENGQGAELLKKKGIIVLPLDITNEKSIEQFYDDVRLLLNEKRYTLKALVNNAGVMIFGEFEWQTKDQMKHQLEVNFLGTMKITHQLMPLIRRDSTRIVVVSSHCASEPLPGVAAYSATKAAINAWATAIRVELKKYGIDVVTFVPGSFTQESNILAKQSECFDAMKESMTLDARHFYKDYFDRYAKYFEPLACKVTPKAVENPRIYEKFEGALLDRYPSSVYKCEPWRYCFYYTLFKITPYYIRDRLTESFVKLPNWKEKNIDKGFEVDSSKGPIFEQIAKDFSLLEKDL
ncbi:estradiol 17-beta-dehydrogenase 2 [Vespa crabro]|uniref:estradiol 17-beta-dehydrogenase 2 n=1 Tax=Vespa crabro TaxID=7445 RepID=UPI001F01A72F|nr:estradiol 17-beta-dehydrogenase 2 [Vespa crabro]XP_046828894.1 estradiol 17-beta-dehydrogenase 2 [Vespa crabro]XP_046828895.1 estradiol 17-beta-dehydrogenase 2 [Vespa crabro]XP_046828896.1 estradiol 17-beta-dehydrogenase 2 [Vespa crabro]